MNCLQKNCIFLLPPSPRMGDAGGNDKSVTNNVGHTILDIRRTTCGHTHGKSGLPYPLVLGIVKDTS